MTGSPDPAAIQTAQAAVRTDVEAEAQKQSGSVADALGSAADITDIVGNVMVEGVGEVIGTAVDVVGSVIGGLLEG